MSSAIERADVLIGLFKDLFCLFWISVCIMSCY